jgi:hypothetical protein
MGPQSDEGSQGRCCQATGSHDHAGHEGCRLWWHRSFSDPRKGPRMASASWSARSMLLTERGADIAATSGDGAARAPPAVGPRRVRAKEVLVAARFSMPRASAPMRRGPPALGTLMAGTFSLFRLPRGHPQCFFPASEDPAVAEEEEGSMAQGKLSLVLE